MTVMNFWIFFKSRNVYSVYQRLIKLYNINYIIYYIVTCVEVRLLLLLRLWGATTAVHEAFLQTVYKLTWLGIQNGFSFPPLFRHF